MSIAFSCPNCQQHITAEDHHGGMTADCPTCKSPLQIPLSPSPASPPPLGNTAGLRRFLNEEQDPAAVQKIYTKVSELCTSGEEIKYIAVQKKPVVTISPDAVVLTNKRAIICRAKLLGFSFQDLLWSQVHDIHVKEGLLGATITLTQVGGPRVEIDSLPKAQARKLYQFGQEMEEKMHHLRRERELEDKRATSGGINIGGHYAPPTPPPVMPVTPPADDPATKLAQLKSFFEQGLISQTEYEAKKADILARF